MGARREPSHVGHVLSRIQAGSFFLRRVSSTTIPAPSHSSQRPCFVLNEKKRGSSVGTENPHFGQALVVEKSSSSPVGERSLSSPSPQLSACSRAASAKSAGFIGPEITRSMVCSVCFLSRGGS